MKSTVYCIILYLSPFLFLFRSLAHLNSSTDLEALLSIRSSITSDPYGVFDSWNDRNTTTTFCMWHGVFCNPTNHRVTRLTLGNYSLVGTLSSHLTNLSFLHVLDLSLNDISGEISFDLHRLFRLEHLNLSSNNFNGIIPSSLSSCSRLRTIDLSVNQLEGTVSFQLGLNLSKLERLRLRHNMLFGAIPTSLGNLSSLIVLDLDSNNLTGSIPTELGYLRCLRALQIGVNSISGDIPTRIFNLSSLKVLTLSENQLSGELPSNMFTSLPNLSVFYAAGDFLHGSIPSSLSNASNLVKLDLSLNQFTGQVPLLWNLAKIRLLNLEKNMLSSEGEHGLDFLSSLTNSSLLEIFSVATNHLSGQLPSSIGNLSTQLLVLLLGENQFYGKIPEDLDNLRNLIQFDMYSNFLTGQIPSSIGKLGNLQLLYMDENFLSGSVLETLGNLTQLFHLGLSVNRLTGRIPTSLWNCRHLGLLMLDHNGLSGNIPKQIFDFPDLEFLTISVNNLTGTFPSEIGSLKMVGYIAISNNQLTGSIPSTIGDCLSLHHLDLSRNSFQGQIPNSLAHSKIIDYLDLSYNQLSGAIPSSLAGLLNLRVLNLSSNKLQGEVPKDGVFSNSSRTFLTGNPNLCGGTPELGLSHCSRPKTRYSRKSKKILIAALSAGSTTLFIIIVFISVASYVRKRKKKHKTSTTETNVISFDGPHRLYSYYDLKSATRDFSEENLIGEGSFGSVYKALMRDETLVAVKVFNMDQPGALKSFLAECEALRNIRHRNLVKILSVCSNPSFKAMVLQFMPNGNLETWLHSKHEGKRVLGLSLKQRLDILINVAAAIKYLHHECETPVVHCDLKPSNILLDEDMIAHVADFGLARMLRGHSQIATSNSTIGLKGSIGYIAPEYSFGAEVSMKGDVYSYGVLVLEMFTGRRPTEEMFIGELNLRRWVEANVPNEVTEILDNQLLESREILEIDQLVSVIIIGLSCVSESPEDRPDMSHISSSLRKTRALLDVR